MKSRKASELITCPGCGKAQVRVFEDAARELENAGWKETPDGTVCTFCAEYLRSNHDEA